MQSCAAPQICCASFMNRQCVDSTLTSCPGGTRIECDGPEDCKDGKLCCASASGASCQASCLLAKPVCHTQADCEGDANNCCPESAGYKTCNKHC
jgi:hypothetical protein